jgi:cephalosporin-C deacetylase-like acetyl esterase
MLEQTITITAHGERIEAAIWLPERAAERPPLVLAGHGLTRHKRALFPDTLPFDLTQRGVAVAAIDAPAHGDRAASDDPTSIGAAWQAHWRAHGASWIAEELSAVVTALESLADTARVGYWGLSLGTQYGLGFIAREPRVGAAVLGLFVMPDIGPRMREYAPAVTCPVLFIRQLDDEIHSADRAQALFDAIGSSDKRMITSERGHTEVPRVAYEQTLAFLEERLFTD